MKLKKSVLAKIKKNKELRISLITLHKNSETTILLWLRTNSPKLIEYSSLIVIANHLDMEIDDMVTETDQVFNQVL
ncbi:MAG: hypothetical protein HQ521_13495 [Bacteroidetes bacterium]|nr:hypothetical protein [Bacteroidota bacterium]